MKSTRITNRKDRNEIFPRQRLFMLLAKKFANLFKEDKTIIRLFSKTVTYGFVK